MKVLMRTNVNTYAANLFCIVGLAILSTGAPSKLERAGGSSCRSQAETASKIHPDSPRIKVEIAEFSISGRGLAGSDEKKS